MKKKNKNYNFLNRFDSCNKEQKQLCSNTCIHLLKNRCTLDDTFCECIKKKIDFFDMIKLYSKRLVLKKTKVIDSKKVYNRKKEKNKNYEDV